jgi:hypothetical protein
MLLSIWSRTWGLWSHLGNGCQVCPVVVLVTRSFRHKSVAVLLLSDEILILEQAAKMNDNDLCDFASAPEESQYFEITDVQEFK